MKKQLAVKKRKKECKQQQSFLVGFSPIQSL